MRLSLNNSPVQEEILEGSKGSVLIIRINRPQVLNSYNLETLTKLYQTIENGSQREEIRVLMICGCNGSFSAGAEIDYLSQRREKADFRTLRKFLEATRNLILLLHRVPQFTISSVDGIAADGGLNLALACDWRISSDRSLLSYPYLEIGLCPDIGSSWLLHAIAGLNRAQNMLITGEQVQAWDALAFGLVHEIYNPYKDHQKPFEVARRLAELPPLVIRNIKRSIISNVNPPDKILSQDIENRMRCIMSEDFDEGIRAFKENRKAIFRNI